MDKNTRSKYCGVKFFSAEDLSTGYNLQKSEIVINNFDETKTITDINHVLELYNILKLFKSGVKLKTWDNDYYDKLTSIVKKFPSFIGLYFSNINDENICALYCSVSRAYINSFWDIFEHYGIYKHISSIGFKKLITSNKVYLEHILIHKKIVNAYDKEITEYMFETNKSAELIIKHFLVKTEKNENEYFFPKNLTPEDKVDLVIRYIDSPDPNTNYLDVIIKGKYSVEFPLTDKIRLSAKKKYDSYWSEHFSNHSGIRYGPSVCFTKSEQAVIINLEDIMNPELIYSSTWISNNLDYPTLLNNFIYLFEFVDQQFRSTFPSKQSNMSPTLIDLVGLKSKHAYNCSMGFKLCDITSLLQMSAYYKQLNLNSIRIEYVFKWFFEVYLKEEFNVEGFIFNPPSSDSTFLEKCRTICSELDSVLKQFNMYVEDNCINRELLELSSSTPLFSEVISFNPQKYGYIEEKELLAASYLLFSDQSDLTYTEHLQDKYDMFTKILINENVKFSDFYDYQQPEIKYLLELNLIIEDENGFLRILAEKCLLLNDMYRNEVICTTYSNLKFIKELTFEKKIILEGTLFSRPEQDYLDYVLNDHKFDNGLKLRNKYIHGANPTDTEQHENDYYQLLKIFSLVIIKINEEFCRRDDTWNK